MKTYHKTCKDCGAHFEASGPAGKFCPEHASIRSKQAQLRGAYSHKLRNGLIKNPGVGKGGGNSSGKEDGQFSTGIAYFMKNRRRIKEERRFCERCEADLLNSNRWSWVIHHRDHDRTNNVDENFELLCKRCHQLEHDCISAFSKTCND